MQLSPTVNSSGKFAVNASVDSSSAVRNGTVYFGARDHNLYAVNHLGKLKWKFATGGQVFGAASVAANGEIYFGSDDSYIYVLNPDGILRSKFKTGDSIDCGSTIGADGTVFVGSWDGFLYALTPGGKLRWKFSIGTEVLASPAMGGHRVIYVGGSSSHGKLYAINPNGTLKWAFGTYGPVFQKPAVGADGTVYVTSYFDAVQHWLCHAIDRGGRPRPTSPADEALDMRFGDESVKMENLSVPANWRLYHNPTIGLSFRYPTFVKVTEKGERTALLHRPNPSAPEDLTADVALLYHGRRGGNGLLGFQIYDHLSPDDIVSERRNNLRGCGYAHHLEIDRHRALACAFCTAVCWWDIVLYEDGRKLKIEPVPIVNGDESVWPVDRMQKNYLQLLINAIAALGGPDGATRTA